MSVASRPRLHIRPLGRQPMQALQRWLAGLGQVDEHGPVTAEPRQTRSRCEHALVRVAHHYGGRSEFVLLGGLLADLLCSTSGLSHAGTTDVDVQLDLEIAGGGVNTRRLERALRNAESPRRATDLEVDRGGTRATYGGEVRVAGRSRHPAR